MPDERLCYEKSYWEKGLFCCGVDEVGRGCVAGPVVAAVVIFPIDHQADTRVKDSKKMSPGARLEVFDDILDSVLDFGVGLVPASEVDLIGISKATEKAMVLAIEQLTVDYGKVLMDGMGFRDFPYDYEAIIKGDNLVYSISAASIVAKVFRDQVVTGLEGVYPGYGFGSHKGYGTKLHFEKINQKGLTPEHRKTFLVEGKHYRTI